MAHYVDSVHIIHRNYLEDFFLVYQILFLSI
nr:MAG TPA: hypothetical protein [Caudoviricetes sp.]